MSETRDIAKHQHKGTRLNGFDRGLDSAHNGRAGQNVWRIVVAAIAGIAVFVGLTVQVGAQTSGPQIPGYFDTVTAQAGGNTKTATFTPTPTHTATVVGTSTPPTTVAGAQQTSANTIANGRGRIANVKDRGFAVVWTTDTESTGAINYGANVSLGTTASDERGPTFNGVTHYVSVGNLQPSTTYFFDLQSGSNVDNNNGQHYQVKTGPDIGQPPVNAYLTGGVFNPGGGSPAGFAVVWGVVRDTDNKGTGGTSQMLASFAGPDGRFKLPVAPRAADVGAFFLFSNQGDTVDLTGRAAAGEKTVQIDTNLLQDGGSSPGDARVVLEVIGGIPPTQTPLPALPTATQNPNPVPTQTPGPFASATTRPTQPPSPTIVPVFPPPVLEPRFPEQLPVQLPPLREMRIVPPLGTAIVTTSDGRVPAGGDGAAGARPVGTAPQTNNSAPSLSGTSPLIAAAPRLGASSPAIPSEGIETGARVASPDVAPGRGDALSQPPIGPAPLDRNNSIVASPPVLPGVADINGSRSSGSVSPSGMAQPPSSANGSARGTGSTPVIDKTIAGRAAEFGQSPSSYGRTVPAVGRRDSPVSTIADRGYGGATSRIAPLQDAAPAGWLDGLMIMHPVVSLLFYGGLGLAAAGIAMAVYGLTSGSAGWRPR